MINPAILERLRHGVCAIGYLREPLANARPLTVAGWFKVVGSGFLVRKEIDPVLGVWSTETARRTRDRSSCNSSGKVRARLVFVTIVDCESTRRGRIGTCDRAVMTPLRVSGGWQTGHEGSGPRCAALGV